MLYQVLMSKPQLRILGISLWLPFIWLDWHVPYLILMKHLNGAQKEAV